MPAGLLHLAEVVAATRLPVLAIGGLSAQRAGSVAAVGAMGVAAIDLFMTAPLKQLPDVVTRCVETFAAGERGVR
jgi:thiamine monophosphate synthase